MIGTCTKHTLNTKSCNLPGNALLSLFNTCPSSVRFRYLFSVVTSLKIVLHVVYKNIKVATVELANISAPTFPADLQHSKGALQILILQQGGGWLKG